jgi:hypothetical protein
MVFLRPYLSALVWLARNALCQVIEEAPSTQVYKNNICGKKANSKRRTYTLPNRTRGYLCDEFGSQLNRDDFDSCLKTIKASDKALMNPIQLFSSRPLRICEKPGLNFTAHANLGSSSTYVTSEAYMSFKNIRDNCGKPNILSQ